VLILLFVLILLLMLILLLVLMLMLELSMLASKLLTRLSLIDYRNTYSTNREGNFVDKNDDRGNGLTWWIRYHH
jgi:hypothetical protein